MEHREISKAIWELDKERRDKIKQLMHEFDTNRYYPERKVLQAECEKIGHNWKFTNLGPLGDPWFMCTICGLSKVEREKDEENQ